MRLHVLHTEQRGMQLRIAGGWNRLLQRYVFRVEEVATGKCLYATFEDQEPTLDDLVDELAELGLCIPEAMLASMRLDAQRGSRETRAERAKPSA